MTITIVICALLLLNISSIHSLQEPSANDEDSKKDIVKFFLFNRDNISGSEPYTIDSPNNISTFFETFSSQRETTIIIHGWLDNVTSQFNVKMREAYFTLDHNVIIVDWSEAGAMDRLYFEAMLHVYSVAKQLAVFVDRFCQEYGLEPKVLHMVGHSLGAHIAGLSYKNITAGKLGRVTGLDPAGPGFSYWLPSDRISTKSAAFVDIIHSCGYYLGAHYETGQADFYPNDGSWPEPGCGMDWSGHCSHMRSYLFFIESIKNQSAFLSTSCVSWSHYKENKCDNDEPKVTMGQYASKLAKGAYFLRTNKNSPFSE